MGRFPSASGTTVVPPVEPASAPTVTPPTASSSNCPYYSMPQYHLSYNPSHFHQNQYAGFQQNLASTFGQPAAAPAMEHAWSQGYYQHPSAAVVQQHLNFNQMAHFNQMPYANHQAAAYANIQLQPGLLPYARYAPYPYPYPYPYLRSARGSDTSRPPSRRKSATADRHKQHSWEIVRPLRFETVAPTDQKRQRIQNKLKIDDPKPDTNKINNLGLLATVA